MPFKDLFLRLLGKKRQSDLNQSINQESIIKSITESAEQPLAQISERYPEPIKLEKDSLQLGIAAGYTGRSLREIESSLLRIESQMPSKDWFLTNFVDRTQELINLFKIHEENEQNRFETIQNLLDSLSQTARKAPEPVRTELFEHIKVIEGQFPITRKMQQLISVVEEFKEISYSELALKLCISESALRGLLTLTIRRTNSIERFDKFGRGWVRFKSD